MAWNDLVRLPLPEPARLDDAVPQRAGSQATTVMVTRVERGSMGFTTGRRIKRVRGQANATIVLVEPKHAPLQTVRGWGRLFSDHRTTGSSKTRLVLSHEVVAITGEPAWARAAWEPLLRSVKYVAPPVKLTEEVSAAARELVEHLVPVSAEPKAAGPREAVNVEARTSSTLLEEFLVSAEIADFVLRGVQATSEIANRQFAADERWAALADLLPPQDPSTPLLRQAITRRVRRMFRSLASEAREDGSQMRLLAGTSSWSIDVQYEIIERLPIRPDETSEFLRALLLDISMALRSGVRIGGGWGHLQISADGELTLAVAPRRELEELVQASTPVRFTRIRRDANSAPL